MLHWYVLPLEHDGVQTKMLIIAMYNRIAVKHSKTKPAGTHPFDVPPQVLVSRGLGLIADHTAPFSSSRQSVYRKGYLVKFIFQVVPIYWGNSFRPGYV